jgi:hypothetical protein
MRVWKAEKSLAERHCVSQLKLVELSLQSSAKKASRNRTSSAHAQITFAGVGEDGSSGGSGIV